MDSLTANLTASHVPGSRTVGKGTKITLRAPSNATMYYTTDGGMPTAKSSKINPGKTKTITVNRTVTVRAFAVRGGHSAGNQVTRKYTAR
jgi:hypothetical protein